MRGHYCSRDARLLLFRCSRYLEVVGYFEDTGNRVRADASSIFVALVDDNAEERHIAVLHRDTDRLGRIDGVLVQARKAIHGTVDGSPDTVIHRRDWIYLDLVDDILDTLPIGSDSDCGIRVHWTICGTA